MQDPCCESPLSSANECVHRAEPQLLQTGRVKAQAEPKRPRREALAPSPPRRRILLIEDDVAAAKLTMRQLESAGLPCSWECVSDEPALQEALGRCPEVILCSAEVTGIGAFAALAIAKRATPDTPFVFISSTVEDSAAQRALRDGASAYVSKRDPACLATSLQAVLKQIDKAPLAGGQRRRAGATTSSGIAGYLLERRAVLDRILDRQDRSAMSSILRRTPPSARALVMIDTPVVRERFAKLLRNANIEIDEADEVSAALTRLEQNIHAVLFTDRIDLIGAARHLHAGAATHVVFVDSANAAANGEALRAGANECMPAEPRGEQFWAHLTTARRIVGLAGYLQLALLDNRLLATVDELTGTGSRRFFEQEFPREVERATQLARPLVLVMCDIDHFKQVNDLYGHHTGDEVLSEFGRRLSGALRLGRDWLARVGGEEFAVVLPDTSLDEGLRIAERLRQHIIRRPFQTAAGQLPITASFGVCGLSPSAQIVLGMADALIEEADGAMYASKRAGRNQITAA